jgi:hypothetical protein
VLYADAYFRAGDRRIKLKDAAEMTWDADASNLMENGWGFVLHCTQGTFYGHGSIPGNLMGKFTERKAYIHALEIMAQVLVIVSTKHLWNTAIWCWMDNEPAGWRWSWSFTSCSCVSTGWSRAVSGSKVIVIDRHDDSLDFVASGRALLLGRFEPEAQCFPKLMCSVE